jgi:polyisoprenoid-binding protein YceI
MMMKRKGKASTENKNTTNVPVPYVQAQAETERFVLNGGSNMTTYSEAAAAGRKVWQLDPAHTLVEFSGKHMMLTDHDGSITEGLGI